MAVRPFSAALVFFSLCAWPLHALAAEGCKLGKIAELPVTMNGLRPMVTAKINGTEAKFIADSGAFFSLIAPASASEYKLRTEPAPFHLMLRGVGGTAEASVTTVKEFTLAGVPIHNIQFVVGGSEPGGGAVGLLGQNVLRVADVEYDLANGVIRLLKPQQGCGKTTMAYWAKVDQPYSLIDIAWATAGSPHTTSSAYLNGARIRILFDTGAATSVLSLKAAARAGVTPDTEGAVRAGFSRGIGSRAVQTWVAPFDSFKIGDEEVRHTRLRIGEITAPDADMLVGADFFLSHRIYVASSQRKLYFTYNGGPVFNLTSAPVVAEPEGPAAAPNEPEHAANEASTASTTSPSTTQQNATPGSTADPVPAAGEPSDISDLAAAVPKDAPAAPIPADEPTDAAGFSRRGTAYAARRDFQHALADLTRACELAPTEPEYFYQRARVRLANREPALGMNDLEQVLKLKPDHVPALITRAALRLSRRDGAADVTRGQILADLDKVNSVAAKEADVRLELGNLYARIGAFTPAIAQYDLWLKKHITEARTADVLASRCRARGMLGQDLDDALSDCNRAVKTRPDTPFFLDSRGLVLLRLGRFDKSIADYDAVLLKQPRSAWALYGRGLAKLRKGMTAEGQADLAASKAIAPRLAEEAAMRGLAP